MPEFFGLQTVLWHLRLDMKKEALNDYEWFEEICRAIKPYYEDLGKATILDVGCGIRYPLTLLFHSFGSEIVGIDTQYIGVNNQLLLDKWSKTISRNGVNNSGAQITYIFLGKYRTYYKTLRQRCDFPLKFEGIDIRQMDVTKMIFADETFDIIISLAAFEHVKNVPEAVSEIKRVMKHGAIAYINIHLFPSLSGGHCRFPENPSTQKVPPWDHLRNKKYRPTAFLNKLRENEYKQIFERELKILDIIDIGKGEGIELLTPEIQEELSDYNKDELTKRGISIIATKE